MRKALNPQAIVALTKSSTFINYSAQYSAYLPKSWCALLLVKTGPTPTMALGFKPILSRCIFSLPENFHPAKEKPLLNEKI
jgi:hypothetical protein